MVPCGDVAVGWAGSVVCEFSACLFTVIVASAVCTVHSVSAFVSHVSLFATSEAGWCVPISR